jgi:hypothetical protein
MWWLFLEAGIALFLLVFIVWWTMFPPKKKPQRTPVAEPSAQPDQSLHTAVQKAAPAQAGNASQPESESGPSS